MVCSSSSPPHSRSSLIFFSFLFFFRSRCWLSVDRVIYKDSEKTSEGGRTDWNAIELHPCDTSDIVPVCTRHCELMARTDMTPPAEARESMSPSNQKLRRIITGLSQNNPPTFPCNMINNCSALLWPFPIVHHNGSSPFIDVALQLDYVSPLFLLLDKVWRWR